MNIYDPEKNKFGFEEENLFGRCEKTLKALAEKRILNVYFHKYHRKFIVCEACDEYFSAELTKEMCEDLSELFSKIANKIEDN